MLKVIVSNFQSIKEAKFKIDGVTLIVGESNEGKSACLRALQAACTNRFKAGQVRFGEDHASIKIKTEESDDVLTVVRSWSGGSPKMKLGDKVFSKLNRTLPKEVTDFLNLGNIDINGESYSCNFHTQFQKPMLLEYSQQKVMEILSASSSLDDLKEAKEYVLSDRANNKGAISAVESLINKTRDKITSISDTISELEDVYGEYESVYLNYEAADEHLSKIEELLRFFEEKVKSENKSKVLGDIAQDYSKYEETCRTLEEVDKVESLLEESEKCSHREDCLSKFLNIYNEGIELKLQDIDVILSHLASEKVNEDREEELLKRLKVLERLTHLENKLEGVNSKRILAEQLEANLVSAEMIRTNEVNLVKIVEEHKCPICGNIVKESI